MARDPGSRWSPLPEAGAPDGHTKTQLIVHSTGTMASAAANFRYFAGGSVVVESTFIVGLAPSDPTLQIMDSTDRADANGSANNGAISIEVVGDGVGPYTQWQVQELIRIGRWAAATHPIAKRVIPSEAASGFGWHVMFGAPGPWTSVRGKVCPGNARIDQLKRVVFPAIFANAPQPAAKPAPAPVPEDDMPYSEKDLNRIVKDAVWQAPFDDAISGKPTQAWNIYRDMQARLGQLGSQNAGLNSAIKALVGLVAAQNGLTVEDVRRVVSEEIAKGVDVDVTVAPGS